MKIPLQYLPVIPQEVSDYAVLKSYLLFLVETTENLEMKLPVRKQEPLFFPPAQRKQAPADTVLGSVVSVESKYCTDPFHTAWTNVY